MYEFVFTIQRQPDHVYTDLFQAHTSLQSHSFYISTCPNRMVRLESIIGETGALEAATEAALNPSLDRESISDRDIEATRYHDLLTDMSTRRVIYSYLGDIRYRDAVATITSQYISDGALVEVFKQADTERYRVLLRSDGKMGIIYDTISARIGADVTFTFERLDESSQWRNELVTPQALPNDQRDILTHAVDRGYFETPRQVSIADLAADLGVPESTASYRLRRATAQLAEHYASQYPADP